MFRVLRPVYMPYFEAFTVSWICMGTARDMAEAKQRFGGYPVLEAVKQ